MSSKEDVVAGGAKYKGTGTKSDLDNHGNQCNPNNERFQGHQKGFQGDKTKAALDNHANQLNPNNPNSQGKK